jgi:glycerol-3-phosphate acyltransferase PlsX
MSSVPARNGGHTHMLDLGANTKATALQLAQFATMGSIVARDVFGIANPRVGLLNIGEEDTKGHELVQEAHELIRASGVNYLGSSKATTSSTRTSTWWSPTASPATSR